MGRGSEARDHRDDGQEDGRVPGGVQAHAEGAALVGRVHRAEEDCRRFPRVVAARAAVGAPRTAPAPLEPAHGAYWQAAQRPVGVLQAVDTARGRSARLRGGCRGHCVVGRQGARDRDQTHRHCKRLERALPHVWAVQDSRADRAQRWCDRRDARGSRGDTDEPRFNVGVSLRAALQGGGRRVGTQAQLGVGDPRAVDSGAGNVAIPRGRIHLGRYRQAAATGVQALPGHRQELGQDYVQRK
mmetsp:Transcript_13186/g.38882  ORF Transcript_13186/g.38882 Transcript_13186/m.38882 type:complete len:242 (-) Transcript_13186:1122-1847(-)